MTSGSTRADAGAVAMSGLRVQGRCAGPYGSVAALGDRVSCYRDGDAVVGEAMNGSVRAIWGDDDALLIAEREGHWSVCRVDASGASCWYEFRGGGRTVGGDRPIETS